MQVFKEIVEPALALGCNYIDNHLRYVRPSLPTRSVRTRKLIATTRQVIIVQTPRYSPVQYSEAITFNLSAQPLRTSTVLMLQR